MKVTSRDFLFLFILSIEELLMIQTYLEGVA